MRQILLFAALAASLALLSGCTLSKTKKDTDLVTVTSGHLITDRNLSLLCNVDTY